MLPGADCSHKQLPSSPQSGCSLRCWGAGGGGTSEMVFRAALSWEWCGKAAKHHRVSSAATPTTQPWTALMLLWVFSPASPNHLPAFPPSPQLTSTAKKEQRDPPPPPPENPPGEATSAQQQLNLACAPPKISPRLGALGGCGFQSRGLHTGKQGTEKSRPRPGMIHTGFFPQSTWEWGIN